MTKIKESLFTLKDQKEPGNSRDPGRDGRHGEKPLKCGCNMHGETGRGNLGG